VVYAKSHQERELAKTRADIPSTKYYLWCRETVLVVKKKLSRDTSSMQEYTRIVVSKVDLDVENATCASFNKSLLSVEVKSARAFVNAALRTRDGCFPVEQVVLGWFQGHLSKIFLAQFRNLTVYTL
jgi:hypothetical protein